MGVRNWFDRFGQAVGEGMARVRSRTPAPALPSGVPAVVEAAGPLPTQRVQIDDGAIAAALAERAAVGLNLGALLSSLSNQNADLRRIFERAYQQHPIVFACINQQATMMAAADFEIGTPGAEGAFRVLPDTDPLVKQFHDLNRLDDFDEAEFFTHCWLMLVGECFWILDRDHPNAEARSMVPVSGGSKWRRLVESDPADGMPRGWIYQFRGQEIVYEDWEVIHHKCPNPYDKDRGMPPLLATRSTVEVDAMARRYQRSLLANGGRMGGVIEFDKDVMPGIDQQRALKAQLEDDHAGPDKAGRFLVLMGGAKFTDVAANPTDLQYLEGLEFDRTEILAALGWNQFLLGISKDANRSDAIELRAQAWDDTLIPLLRRRATTRNKQYLHTVRNGRVEGRYNTKNVPAIVARRRLRIADLNQLLQARVSRDQASKWLGLELEPEEGSDIPMVPAGVLPVSQILEPLLPAAPTTGPDGKPMPKPEGDDPKPTGNAAKPDTADPKATLNGAQISSLLEVIDKVATGDMSKATGVEVIVASFPFDETRAQEILADIEEGEKPKPQPPVIGPPAPPAADDGDDEPEPETEDEKAVAQRILVADAFYTAARGSQLLTVPDHETRIPLKERRKLWRRWMKTVRGPVELASERVFRRYHREWAAAQMERFDEATASRRALEIGPHQRNGGIRRKVLESADIERILFDLGLWDSTLRERVRPMFADAGELAMAYTLGEFGTEGTGDMVAPSILEYIDERVQLVVGINETAQTTLADQLLQGIQRQESLAEIRGRIQTALGKLAGPVRTQRIARTEVGHVANGLRTTIAVESGFTKHSWISAADDVTRTTHRADDIASARTPVLIGERFPNTGLRFCQEPGGPAREVINCRCLNQPEPDREVAAPPATERAAVVRHVLRLVREER